MERKLLSALVLSLMVSGVALADTAGKTSAATSPNSSSDAMLSAGVQAAACLNTAAWTATATASSARANMTPT